MTKPFLPSDLAKRQPLAVWRRHAVVSAMAAVRGDAIESMAAKMYGAGEVSTILRGAVSPLDSAKIDALTPTAIGAFLSDLRPISAAAQLIEAGVRLEMDGYDAILLPHLAADFPEPAFVAEGMPIPVKGGAFANSTLGPKTKLAMIATMTSEVDFYSAADAETLVTDLMNDAASRALDKAVFSSAAASGMRPAGILAGVPALTPTPDGGAAALIGDIKNLVAAIVAAGAGGQIMIFANPVQVVALHIMAPAGVGFPVIPAASLAIGQLVAIDPRAFASGFGPLPEVQAARESAVHFEDVTPAPFSVAGSPPIISAPIRSMFQQDLVALRLVLRCAWTLRSAAIAHVSGVTW